MISFFVSFTLFVLLTPGFLLNLPNINSTRVAELIPQPADCLTSLIADPNCKRIVIQRQNASAAAHGAWNSGGYVNFGNVLLHAFVFSFVLLITVRGLQAIADKTQGL